MRIFAHKKDMWAALIPYLVQGIAGMFQESEGTDLANTPRPDYKIPDEVNQSLAISKANFADQTMPGESRLRDQNNLAAQNALKALTEGGGSLSGISGIQAQQSKFAGDIQTKAAEYQRKDEQIYQQSLQTMADYKDQQFQMNEFAPYAQAYQEGRQMAGAGFENIYGALSGIANITMANQYANQDPAALAASANQDALQTSNINAAYQKMGNQAGYVDPSTGYGLTVDQINSIMRAMTNSF